MDTFEGCMKMEAYYARFEHACARSGDFHGAAHFHAMRWRCMDAAVKLVEKRDR